MWIEGGGNLTYDGILLQLLCMRNRSGDDPACSGFLVQSKITTIISHYFDENGRPLAVKLKDEVGMCKPFRSNKPELKHFNAMTSQLFAIEKRAVQDCARPYARAINRK
jgi:hypothetical protein